jgi:hypothetical protein
LLLLLLQVPKEFNVWSLDALSAEMSDYIINLNIPDPLTPTVAKL